MCYFKDDECTACSLAVQKIYLLNMAQFLSQAKPLPFVGRHKITLSSKICYQVSTIICLNKL
jgi:hypothetical protein